jgi:hypothetical protein
MSAFDPKRTSIHPLLLHLNLLGFEPNWRRPKPWEEGYVRRRDFIKVVAGSAAGWSIAASAQQPERARRVVMLLGFDEADLEAQSRAREFRLGMRDLGWINGRNIQIEFRFAGSNPA